MTRTLRLDMPQWQGGNEPAYRFGADLLAFLAPEFHEPIERTMLSWHHAGPLCDLEPATNEPDEP